MDDSVEALDAAAVEAALSLCEETASDHALPGPWETQELKPAGPAPPPTPPVKEPSPSPTPQAVPAVPALVPAASTAPTAEVPDQAETKREEELKESCEGPEVTGRDGGPSVTSEDVPVGSEAAEEGTALKKTIDTAVKSEGEEWSQPEPNPPCLGG